MEDLTLENVYVYLLERTIRQVKRHFHEQLKALNPDLNITSDQWVIIKRISERDEINQREVAAVTGKDPASITRTVDLLAKKGWVVRKEVAGDRRAYQLVLTAAGWDLVKLITPLAQASRQAGLEGVSDQEFATFKATLNKIYDNLS